MQISDIYQSGGDYLKAEDLQGRRVAVTIEKWTTKEFEEKDGFKHQKIILSFRGKDKQFVVNKTNAVCIADILGDDPDSWIGGQITLYTARVMFGDKVVDGLRVVLPEGSITGDSPPPPLTAAVQSAAAKPLTDSDGDPIALDSDDVPF